MASTISAGTTTTTSLVYTADTSGVLQLQTNGTTTAVTIDTAQNVGVGVTPSAWGSGYTNLQLNGGSVSSQSTSLLRLFQNAYTNSSYNTVFTNNGYASLYTLSSGGHAWFTNSTNNSSGAGAACTFTQAMTLNNSGNLFLGAITVSGTSTATPVQVNLGSSFANSAGASGLAKLQLYTDSSGTNNVYGIGVSNGQIEYYTGTTGAHVWFKSNNTTPLMQINSNGTYLFNTTSVTSASLIAPAFQIAANTFSSGANAGYFWENRTATATSNTNWYGWYTTSGVIYVYNGGGNAASINPSTGAYTALSDINFKKDISASTLGLNEILKLKPSFYRMKTDAETDPLHLGFIAQDVQSVIPQAYVEIQNDETCATGQPSTFIGLNDRAIIATLVSAIQELSAKVTALEAKVA